MPEPPTSPALRPAGPDFAELPDAVGSATLACALTAHATGAVELFALEVRLATDAPMTFIVRVDHARSTSISAAGVLELTAGRAVELGCVLDSAEHPPIWYLADPARVAATLSRALDVPRPPIGVDPSDPTQRLRPALKALLGCLPAAGSGDVDDGADHREMARELRLSRRFAPVRPDPCEDLQLRATCGMRSRRFGWALGAELRALVGGADELAALDTAPLPDEPFQWQGVPDDARPAVEQILELCDRSCSRHFDVEVRTAARRLLHRIATTATRSLRGNGSVHTAAAAIVWTVASRNHLLGGTKLSTKHLLEGFAVGGSVSSRAGGLLRAAGFGTDATAPEFSAQLLTSARRSTLISLRDALADLSVLRLSVTLEGTSPPVERVVDVEADQDLMHLHEVLRVLVGWTGTYPAAFHIGELTARTDPTVVDRQATHLDHEGTGRWGSSAPVELDDLLAASGLRRGIGSLDDVGVTVSMDEAGLGALSVGDVVTYVYGDRWSHRITVDSVTPLLHRHGPLPAVVSARGAAPPESLGGPQDYRRVLELLGTDREPELSGVLRSCPPAPPGGFDPWRPDPAAVDLEGLARSLRDLAA